MCLEVHRRQRACACNNHNKIRIKTINSNRGQKKLLENQPTFNSQMLKEFLRLLLVSSERSFTCNEPNYWRPPLSLRCHLSRGSKPFRCRAPQTHKSYSGRPSFAPFQLWCRPFNVVEGKRNFCSNDFYVNTVCHPWEFECNNFFTFFCEM